jgi:hypothetical protein
MLGHAERGMKGIGLGCGWLELIENMVLSPMDERLDVQKDVR